MCGFAKLHIMKNHRLTYEIWAQWRNKPDHERRTLMVLMRKHGLTTQEIGIKFGISKERARQILKEENAVSAAESARIRYGKCNFPKCTEYAGPSGCCKTHVGRKMPEEYSTEHHGMARTPTYSCWHNMKQRCTNPNNPNYPNYGGRGISVCKRWMNSFIAFVEDMGEKPQNLTLQRKDNNGNYEPDNCIWADWVAQAANRRNRKPSGRKRIPNQTIIARNNEILEKYTTGKYLQKELAKEYDLHPVTISRIITQNIVTKD